MHIARHILRRSRLLPTLSRLPLRPSTTTTTNTVGTTSASTASASNPLPFILATATISAAALQSDAAVDLSPSLHAFTPLEPPESPDAALLRRLATADPSALQSVRSLSDFQLSRLVSHGLIPALFVALSKADPPAAISLLDLLFNLLPTHPQLLTASHAATLHSLLASTMSYFSIPFFSASPLDNLLFHHTSRLVASLATNPATHQALLSAPLLSTLSNALRYTPSDDGVQHDAYRHALLSVAALARSAPHDALKCSLHRTLIAVVKGNADAAWKTIAMGGLKNMAAVSGAEDNAYTVHRELVLGGVCDALMIGLKGNGKMRQFAIRTWADVMATRHQKRHLVQKRMRPSFQHFAVLMQSKDSAVVSSVAYAISHVNSDIDDELANAIAKNASQWVNGPVKRGVIPALSSVVVLADNPVVANAMVDSGLIEVLVNGVQRGKGEYWRNSIAALASLSQYPQHAQLLVSRGALKSVIRRPYLEHDAEDCAKFFANVARHAQFHSDIAHHAANTIMLALSGKNKQAKQHAVRAILNLSLGGISKVMMIQRGAIPLLINAARDHDGEIRRLAIAALAEMSDAYDQGTKLVEAGALDVLLKAVKDDESLSKSVARTFGNMSMVPEVHGSLATSGAVEWMVSVISRIGGKWDSADTMLCCTIGVTNVAYSPGIARSTLQNCNAPKVLTSLTATGMSSPIILAASRQALRNMKGENGALWPMEPKPSLPE